MPFCIRKELKAQPLFKNETFEAATYIRYVFIYMYYITIKICPNQQTSSNSFYRGFFEKGLELVSRSHFS